MSAIVASPRPRRIGRGDRLPSVDEPLLHTMDLVDLCVDDSGAEREDVRRRAVRRAPVGDANRLRVMEDHPVGEVDVRLRVGMFDTVGVRLGERRRVGANRGCELCAGWQRGREEERCECGERRAQGIACELAYFRDSQQAERGCHLRTELRRAVLRRFAPQDDRLSSLLSLLRMTDRRTTR